MLLLRVRPHVDRVVSDGADAESKALKELKRVYTAATNNYARIDDAHKIAQHIIEVIHELRAEDEPLRAEVERLLARLSVSDAARAAFAEGRKEGLRLAMHLATHKCEACGGATRATTAGCDHCAHEDK